MNRTIIHGYFSLLAVTAVGHAQNVAPAKNDSAAPIILISVDTLRADRLSCYGYSASPTPNIDSLASRGTLFSAASAQVPLTLPSHASLLTSTYPFFNGVRDNGEQVPRNLVTLASVLRGRGYRTAAFVGGFVMDRSVRAKRRL
ncbi:MAG: sulfatase-like hydrolase/transferase [Acidobacteria bacterium]|nr:sulfatase-like hydrolase/transferase [Acidobacteriota bacterium]